MTPGPDYFYKCPNCSNIIKRWSLASGNTFGAKDYSDGKRIAPMFPVPPYVTKCKKCATIFWLEESKEVGTQERDKKPNPAWENADEAEYLEIDDYFEVLKTGKIDDEEEEMLYRMFIWWAYNDRIRDGKEIFIDKNDEAQWKENCQELIKLLDATEEPQKILMDAELNRNLGNFDISTALLKSGEDDELNKIREKMLVECDNKNRWVVEFTSNIENSHY